MSAAREAEPEHGLESAPEPAPPAVQPESADFAGFPAGVSNLYVARVLASDDPPMPAVLRQGKGSYAGGTWQTGPAKVVPLVPVEQVDAKKASLLDKAKALKDIATNTKDLAGKVQSFGEKGWDDDDVIAMAKSVNGIHGSVNKIAGACTKLAGVDSQLIAGDAKAVEYLDKAIQAAETVQTMVNAKASADAFAANPSYETASAWADGVGDVFDKAGAYLPTGALPSFMGDYFKGLFSAPKNYIAAFKGMMEQRYKGVEAATGVPFMGIAHNKGAWEGGGYVWEGEMTGLFIGASLSGDHMVANELQSYMRSHRKIGGVDLYGINNPAVGAGLLQSQIENDSSLTDEQKEAYLKYLGTATGGR